ncbi:hypothetical protein [Streptomyces edwardsiae]|uniref:Glycosyltransferase n=2 Tax=Streptomyces TaxID=1883 RepID=A0ABU2QLF7_9ACTN|nr:hypothetical protein [Streptomyces sp. DSM 41635]MDT0405287.1 hypothetical protein [Streptomyces sp. DSM 41635]
MAAARALSQAHPALGARIVSDPEPEGPPSALRTARLAWQAVAPGATHHLVVQDDALPLEGFAGTVAALAAARPQASLSLFTEWGSRTANAVRAAALLGHAWAPVVDDYLPSVALVLPVRLALGFEEYAAAKATPEATDDVTLLDYVRGVDKLVPVAGPVDHANPPSLVGNEVMGPRSAACLSAAADPGGSVLPAMSAVPYFCWWEQLAVVYVHDPAAPGGWRRVPAGEVLAQRGIGREQVVGALRQALEILPYRAFVHDRVSDVLLAEVWTTAYTLGVVTRDLGAPDGGFPDPTRPAARTALATLVPGALRRVVPVRWLAAVGELLYPLVEAAVLGGARDVMAAGGGPVLSGGVS